MEETPHLNPSDLYDKRKSKDVSRLRAYNKILEQIYNRIRVLSRLPNAPCYLLYTVPPFIFGLPKIDLEDCIIYLIYQLRHAKYDVRFTYPNVIYISWIHHEQSYIIEKSPIMQSMIASAEKTQMELEQKEKEISRLMTGRKSSKKVKIQEPGLMQSMQSIRAGHIAGPISKQVGSGSFKMNSHINQNKVQSVQSVGPPPPSASDYVPPMSFLQNMSNPQNTVIQPKSNIDYFK